NAIDDTGRQRDITLGDVLEQAFDLGNQQARAGNVDDGERATRLVGRGARHPRGCRAVAAGLDRALQVDHRIGERTPDLLDAPRERLESGRHDHLGFAGNIVGRRHQETLNLATEFFSSCESSESWRMEPAVCKVPSDVCSVTSRMRWIDWATVPADAACREVVSEKSSISSARCEDTRPISPR